MSAKPPLVLDILRYLAKPEGYTLAEEILAAVGAFYPPALAGEVALKEAAPTLQRLAGLASTGLAAGLMDGSLILMPDGVTIIKREWADDPRHWLNPDGSFMNAAQIDAHRRKMGLK